MPVLSVQLNHLGNEKEYTPGCEFISGSGYYSVGSQIVREWNSEQHYRKFIRNEGVYIKKIGGNSPEKETLLFWGEWEGYSCFYPLGAGIPNGIHEPFHSINCRGTQNTDPYVFGDCFNFVFRQELYKD
ncbi:hypothetical protein ES705_44490 [subsurface metagenome]